MPLPPGVPIPSHGSHHGALSATRRGMVLSVPLLSVLQPRKVQAAAAVKPVLDQPMTRIKLPAGAVGRDYVLLRMKLGGKGPYDFMVDTGLTAELITPHLREVLGLPAAAKLERGLAAGGSVQGAELVVLKDAQLMGAEGLQLPPLTAVVTDFLQEHIDPEHDPVEGMLGMELLQMFDTDLDFPAGRIRLWEPGTGIAAAQAAGLAEVPAAVLNETGVLGIRATSAKAVAAAGGKNGNSGGGGGQGSGGGGGVQPFVGILDCGASFSALNWQAAALAGLPPKSDPSYYGDGKSGGVPGVSVLGVDGKPQVLPMTPVSFTFVGDAARAPDSKGFTFDPPPPGWQPWDYAPVGVGDLPIFAQLLGDGNKPYAGPAALIGLDVLAQRRVVVGAGVGVKGRARKLYVGKTSA